MLGEPVGATGDLLVELEHVQHEPAQQHDDQRAVGVLQLVNQRRMDSAAVAQKRRLVLKVRGWIYEVIDRFLGGVEKLPNTVSLGALPHLAVGGVVATVAIGTGSPTRGQETKAAGAPAKTVG